MNQSNMKRKVRISDDVDIIHQADQIAEMYVKDYPVTMLTMGHVLCGFFTRYDDKPYSLKNTISVQPHPIQRNVVYEEAKCQSGFDVVSSQKVKGIRDENGNFISEMFIEELNNLGLISVCRPKESLYFVIEGQQRIVRTNTILLCGRELAIKLNLNPDIIESINQIILKDDGKIRFSELTDEFQNDVWKEYAGEYNGKKASENDIVAFEERIGMKKKDCEIDQLFDLYYKDLENFLEVNNLYSNDDECSYEEKKEKIEQKLEMLIKKICYTPVIVKEVPYRKASAEFRATNTTNIPVGDVAIIYGSMLAEFRVRDEVAKEGSF